jgi:hypothetical protein
MVRAKKPTSKPAGNALRARESMTEAAGRGLAIGTQGWVQDKVAAGEIAGGMSGEQSGTSIFDPVLCELAYRWFCPPGGLVLDPFAGGSVRGIVASKLGRRYLGVDLRSEQVDANRVQAMALCNGGAPVPEWFIGDSREMPLMLPEEFRRQEVADFVFSCPPYADLERYSDDPRDLSTMPYAEFLVGYQRIISTACRMLKPDRFACFVVGDVRDEDGLYYGFPSDTIKAFEAAGLRLYNEAILVTAVGSLPIRVGRQFETTRKLGKTHQNILVFVNGDPRKATEAIGDVQFGALEAEPGPAASETAEKGVTSNAGELEFGVPL